MSLFFLVNFHLIPRLNQHLNVFPSNLTRIHPHHLFCHQSLRPTGSETNTPVRRESFAISKLCKAISNSYAKCVLHNHLCFCHFVDVVDFELINVCCVVSLNLLFLMAFSIFEPARYVASTECLKVLAIRL